MEKKEAIIIKHIFSKRVRESLMRAEEERSFIKTYGVAMFMLAFLDEWSRVERIGVVSKIYNRLLQKHSNFHKQIDDVKRKRKKAYSKKCALFIEASAYSIAAWERVLSDTKAYQISANTTIHNLYRLDALNFTKLYGLEEDVFRELNNNTQGVTLQSCRVARLLLEALESIIETKKSEVKNIYSKE